MDIIRFKEWRIFPDLSLFKDELVQQIFLIAHILIINSL